MMSSLETGTSKAVWAGKIRVSVSEILSWRHVASNQKSAGFVSWVLGEGLERQGSQHCVADAESPSTG